MLTPLMSKMISVKSVGSDLTSDRPGPRRDHVSGVASCLHWLVITMGLVYISAAWTNLRPGLNKWPDNT